MSSSAAKKGSEVIPPDAYPQMMSTADAARAMNTLRSAQVAVKAAVAMEAAVPSMHAAILQYVEELEEAGADMVRVFDKVHEIRGFAETAGLVTAGRISEILCRYMDELNRLGRAIDPAIVALHVGAIANAARAPVDDLKMGEVVAGELSALVTRKLAELGAH
jgi:hypothetical protein